MQPKLTATDYFKLAIILVLSLFLLYRALLPWRAEYAFREAFNQASRGLADQAVAKYHKAIALAPWETFYMVKLAALYEAPAREAQKQLASGRLTAEQRVAAESKLLVNIEQAEKIYRRCIDISPKNPWFQSRRGELYGMRALLAKEPAEQAELLRKREEQILLSGELDPNNGLFSAWGCRPIPHQR